MSWKHLGEIFDIHGGGIDLVFPHHENEIAQSRCAFHSDVMANYWMHNGFLQVEGEKMSKSLGNFVTMNELLKDWPGEVVRLNMLKSHYRQPIDFTDEALASAAEGVKRLGVFHERLVQLARTGASRANAAVDTLAAYGQTMLAAVGADSGTIASITSPGSTGKVIAGALAS